MDAVAVAQLLLFGDGTEGGRAGASIGHVEASLSGTGGIFIVTFSC